MTTEAQNALLKTLEEPPARTVLLLTARSEQSLLPTVRSRLQAIHLRQPAKTAVLEHFKTQASDEELNRLYALSGGLPGLLYALLSDAEHHLRAAAEKAREVLQKTPYERLLLVDATSKDKQLAADVLAILQQMAHLSLRSAQGAAVRRWQHILEASYEAEVALRNNGQPKLVLTDLFLNL